MKTNGKTKIIGIFGHPVEHSFSPEMHNVGFEKLDLNYHYIPLPVAPENLEDAVKGFRAMGLQGANVTVPHKISIIPFLDKVSEISEKMGSVNTLYWEEDKLCGTTTDPYGALECLIQNKIALTNQKVALLGTGGAARAIAFAFALDYPEISLTILGRSLEKCQTLSNEIAEKTGRRFECAEFKNYADIAEEQQIIINATSVGMHPMEGQSPIAKEEIFTHQTVFDIIYNPEITLLMKHAKEQEATVIGGLGMLVYQGVKSFEYWTGQKAPVEDYFETLENR